MNRSYRLFKMVGKKLKFMRAFNNMQDATTRVRKELGLQKFQKCKYLQTYDGLTSSGMRFVLDGKDIYVIQKELTLTPEDLDGRILV